MLPDLIDVRRARLETPGCAHVLHFNNAGAALMPQCVLEAVTGHLQLEAQIGGYEAAERRHEAIAGVHHSLATLLGCTPDEVAVVENATRAWDMAFYAIPLRPGDRILTAQAEYVSNYLAFLQVAQRTGALIEVIPNDESGQISLDALRDRIDEHVRLIAITHVPTNGGLVNPAAEVGQIARAAGVLYLLDACQSIGQMPVDAATVGCDILSGTGRKFLRGPARHGLPLRAACHPRPVGAALRQCPCGHLDGARSLRIAARRQPLRELGDQLRRQAGVWAQRWTTPWGGEWTPFGRMWRSWRRSYAGAWRSCPA